VLLYHVVTGGYPVESGSLHGLREKHAQGAPKLLRDERADLPAEFAKVVETALAPIPEQRFATAGEMGRGLSAAVSEGIQGAGPRNWKLAVQQSVPVPSWFAAGLSAAVVLAALLLLASHLWPAAPYDVQAALYRVQGTTTEPLLPGATIAPGDRLLLELMSTADLHVYVLSHDDRGESYLLFPMSGSELANPLPATQLHRLPGTRNGVQMVWTVTSSGGREHLVIVANRGRLREFEADIHDLDLPAESVGGNMDAGVDADEPVAYARVPDEAVARLRGIGGATTHPLPAIRKRVSDVFIGIETLATHVESVRGVWVRQIDLLYAHP
jgi:hypothetical protein